MKWRKKCEITIDFILVLINNIVRRNNRGGTCCVRFYG